MSYFVTLVTLLVECVQVKAKRTVAHAVAQILSDFRLFDSARFDLNSAVAIASLQSSQYHSII